VSERRSFIEALDDEIDLVLDRDAGILVDPDCPPNTLYGLNAHALAIDNRPSTRWEWKAYDPFADLVAEVERKRDAEMRSHGFWFPGDSQLADELGLTRRRRARRRP